MHIKIAIAGNTHTNSAILVPEIKSFGVAIIINTKHYRVRRTVQKKIKREDSTGVKALACPV